MALRAGLRFVLSESSVCRSALAEVVTAESCSTSGRASTAYSYESVRWLTKHKKAQRSLNNSSNWVGVHDHIRRRDQLESSQKPATQPEVIATAVPLVELPSQPEPYVKVGRLTDAYELPEKKAFAVVEVAGSQFKVTRDDLIFPNKLSGVDVNDILALQRVLLAGDPHTTVIGRPHIPNARVLAAVESHFKDAKTIVFKKKPGTITARHQGHRQQMTVLRILDIQGVDGLELEPLQLPVATLEQPADPEQLKVAAAAAAQDA